MHRHIVAAAAAAALNRVRGRGICTASSNHYHHVSIVPISIPPPTSRGVLSPFHKLVLSTVTSWVTRGACTGIVFRLKRKMIRCWE